MANYAVTNSVEGNNIEGTFKVNYSNYNSNYNYRLRISIPRVSFLQRIYNYVSDYEFTLTSGTIAYLLEDVMKTTSEINLGFAVETYDGDTLLSSGNEKVVKCYVTDANPIFTNFQVTEQNEYVESLTGSTINNIVHVNNYSNIAATIFALSQKAIAQKGATMVKYRLVIGDSSCDIPYDERIDESGYIEKASTGIYNVYAIDSRGNSTLVTKQAIEVKDYFDISFNKTLCKIERDNNGVGSHVILTLNGDIWNNNFGVVTNSITSVEYRFKKTDSDRWIYGTTPITPTVNDNSFTFTGQISSDNQDTSWDLDSSYNVQILITDELSTSTIDLIVNSAIPTICLDKNGVGIMCAYDSSLGGYLQVGGKIIDGGTIIWENSSPNNSFPAQTITLDESLDNYDMYAIVFRQSVSASRYFNTGKIPVGNGTILGFFTEVTYWRPTGTTVSGNTITFENGRIGSTVDNNYVIPLYVIGYKTGLF